MSKQHVIDAKGRPLGRVATEIVWRLRGKDHADFSPEKDPRVLVIVTNVRYIRLSGKKASEKVYKRYSGYPGGLHMKSFQDVFAKRPEEVVRRAVYGMLPKNRLRAKMLRRLKIFVEASR